MQIFGESHVVGFVIAAAFAEPVDGLGVVFVAQILDVRILFELWFTRGNFHERTMGSARWVSILGRALVIWSFRHRLALALLSVVISDARFDSCVRGKVPSLGG